MPMTSQFALSVELTKLLPLVVETAGKSYDTALTVARNIQGSGSNIILEENLVQVFGRMRIDQNLSSSFRSIISKSRHNGVNQFYEQLGLHWGPGPSVTRAFDDQSYMAMLVQCSLLASIHERKSLADSISMIFEKRAEAGPVDQMAPPFPRVSDIEGYIRACEDQTAQYDWSLQLLAVASRLGLPNSASHQALPAVILRSLPDMAPWIQHWPENHIMTAEIGTGICFLVVWTHLVLGIPVLVKVHWKTGLNSEVSFGVSPEIFIINFYEHGVTSTITLLSQSDPGVEREKLTIRAGPDEEELRADPHAPAKGYAIKVFETMTTSGGMQKRLLSEFSSLTLAFAHLISEHISIITGGSSLAPQTPSDVSITESMEIDYTAPLPDINAWKDFEDTYIEVPKSKLATAVNVLFEGQKWSQGQLDQFKNLYYGKRLTWIKDPPDFIKPLLQEDSNPYLWRDLRNSALRLGQLALAFTQVQVPDDYSLLPLGLFQGPFGTELGDRVYIWQGEGPIRVNGDVWFQTIARAMIGVSGSENFTSACVVSERGWSIFYNTLGDPDPGLIYPGLIAVRRGVPWCRGIWKHRVVDASVSSRAIYVDNTLRRAGDAIQLRCLVPMKFGPLLCGEAGDSFVVSRKILISNLSAIKVETQASDATEDVAVMRVGYRTLYLASQLIRKTNPCEHGDFPTNKTVLGPGCVALAGVGTLAKNDFDQQLMIFLTATDKVARWAAITACYRQKPIEWDQFVMVRIHGCCIQCAIDQAQLDETVRKLIL